MDRGQRDIKLVLDEWFAEGATHAPDRIIDEVLGEVARTPQSWTAWPSRSIQRFAGLAAAAVLVLAVTSAFIFAAAQLNRSSGPAASPSPTPSPSASDFGFQPPVLLEGLDGWRVVRPAGANPAAAVHELLLKSPGGTSAVVMQPDQAIEADGTVINAPPFIDSWLWTRGELTFIRSQIGLDLPPAITVDGIVGRDLEGFARADAHANASGAVVLLCATEFECSPDSAHQLEIHRGDHFRIVVLNVRGISVVVSTSSNPELWEPTNADFTDLLNAIRFHGF